MKISVLFISSRKVADRNRTEKPAVGRGQYEHSIVLSAEFQTAGREVLM